MGEIKQANFKIDIETANKFRAFCKENGIEQAEGFNRIMASLEMSQAKTTLHDRKLEISEFERHATALTNAYLQSLELESNTEERVREEFETLLKSKDEIIADLQNERNELKETLKATEEKISNSSSVLETALNEKIKVKKELEELRVQHQTQLSTLEEAKNSLSELCANLSKQLKEVEPLKTQLKEMESLKVQLEKLQSESLKKEYAHKEEVFALKEQIQNEKMLHITEIAEYQKRYKELLDQK